MKKLTCRMLSIITALNMVVTLSAVSYSSDSAQIDVDMFVSKVSYMIEECCISENSQSFPTIKERSYFETARLIVKSDKKIDTLNAVSVISGYMDLWILQFNSSQDAAEAYEYYDSLECVEYVEADSIITTTETAVCSVGTYAPKSEYLSWGAKQVGFDELYEYIYENDIQMKDVTVGVIDTGVNSSHPFLEGRIIQTNFNSSESGESESSEDDNGHGTHVAGIIADCTSENIKIAPYKVFNSHGEGSHISIAAGIYKAIEDNVDVINMSFGGDGSISLLKALEYAQKKGILSVASAGNTASKSRLFPASYDMVIGVSATTEENELAYFSAYGKNSVEIAAPGYQINSAFLNDEYELMDGTSMAAPFVSAVAAVTFACNPKLTAVEIRALLNSTAVPLNDKLRQGFFGSGLVNALCAISAENCSTIPEITNKESVFSDSTTTQITCSDSNADIYYTTDGSIPNKSSTLYSGETIAIEEQSCVMAASYSEGKCRSLVAMQDYRKVFEVDGNTIGIYRSGVIYSYSGDSKTIKIPEMITETDSEGTFTVAPTELNMNIFADNGITKTSMQYVELPDTVTKIGEKAFYNNYELETIIAKGVVSIDSSAFENCKKLTAIDFPMLEEAGKRAFTNVGSESNRLVYAYAPKLKELNASLFSGSGVSTVDLPEANKINDNVFSECKNLVNINLPLIENLESKNVFAHCDSISKVNMPMLKSVPYQTFYSCVSLKEISLPNVLSVGDNAFRGCSALRNVSLDMCEVVGAHAFANCSVLENIVLPKARKIQGDAFDESDCLKNCEFPELTEFTGDLSMCVLPYSIERIIVPKLVKLPDFSWMALSEFDFSSAQTVSSFFNCYNLKSISLPNVTSIESDYVFANNNQLEYIHIPKVQTISKGSVFSGTKNAFVDARSLVSTASMPKGGSILLSSKFNHSKTIPQEMTIYGTAGTYAEEFAIKNSLDFISVPFVSSTFPDEIPDIDSTVKIDALGFDLSYQWYFSSSNSTNGGKAIKGATESSYSFSINDTAPYYYCVITSNDNGIVSKTTTDVMKRKPMDISADYTALDNAIAAVPKDLSIYTDESVSALQSAIDAVEYDLDITEQNKVDEYAQNILTATQNLKKLHWWQRLLRAISALFKKIISIFIIKN